MYSSSLAKDLNKAKKFSLNGNNDEAFAIYNNILKKFPKNQTALKQIQNLYSRSNEHEQINIINFYNSGNFYKGIEECNRLLQIYPKDPILLNFMGALNGAIGKLIDAEFYYFQSIEIDDTSSTTWSNLATIQFSLKKYKDSKNSCIKSIQLNKYNPEALNNLGNVYLELNQKNEALKAFEKSIKLNPGSHITNINLGNLYQKLKDYEKAIYHSQKSLSIHKTSEGFYNLGCAYRDTGSFDLAISHYCESIKLNTKDGKAFKALMELVLQIGYWKKFQNEFINYINLNNCNTEIYFYSIYNIIYTFINGDFVSAKIELKKLNSFFSQGISSEFQKEKDEVFLKAYYVLMSRMIDYHWNNSFVINNNCEKIFHLGESHSLAFANCNIRLKDKLYQVEPLITFGLKAWHLSQTTQNRFKSIFTQRLKSIPDNSKVMISIGEIDCRENEGIIYNHLKTGQNIEKIIERTITGYINFVSGLMDQKNLEVFFLSVPAPVLETKKEDHSNKLKNQELRAQVVKKFNETLHQKVKAISSKYIDTYSLTSDNNGFSNNKFHIDGIHLKPNILQLIQNKIK